MRRTLEMDRPFTGREAEAERAWRCKACGERNVEEVGASLDQICFWCGALKPEPGSYRVHGNESGRARRLRRVQT